MENDSCVAFVRASTGAMLRDEMAGATAFVETPRIRPTGLKRPLLLAA